MPGSTSTAKPTAEVFKQKDVMKLILNNLVKTKFIFRTARVNTFFRSCVNEMFYDEELLKDPDKKVAFYIPSNANPLRNDPGFQKTRTVYDFKWDVFEEQLIPLCLIRNKDDVFKYYDVMGCYKIELTLNELKKIKGFECQVRGVYEACVKPTKTEIVSYIHKKRSNIEFPNPHNGKNCELNTSIMLNNDDSQKTSNIDASSYTRRCCALV